MPKMHFTSILPASKTPQIFARPLNSFQGVRYPSRSHPGHSPS